VLLDTGARSVQEWCSILKDGSGHDQLGGVDGQGGGAAILQVSSQQAGAEPLPDGDDGVQPAVGQLAQDGHAAAQILELVDQAVQLGQQGFLGVRRADQLAGGFVVAVAQIGGGFEVHGGSAFGGGAGGVQELVGHAGHSGDHRQHLVPVFRCVEDDLGDGSDALRAAHRCAAEFKGQGRHPGYSLGDEAAIRSERGSKTPSLCRERRGRGSGRRGRSHLPDQKSAGVGTFSALAEPGPGRRVAAVSQGRSLHRSG